MPHLQAYTTASPPLVQAAADATVIFLILAMEKKYDHFGIIALLKVLSLQLQAFWVLIAIISRKKTHHASLQGVNGKF